MTTKTLRDYALIAVAEVFGIAFLWVPCLAHAWTSGPVRESIKPWPSGTANVGPYRPYVDEWIWAWLNHWYANVEDGVKGLAAYVWQNDQLVPYARLFPSWVPDWVIAYAWSAWRNGANNIKRPFR